MADHKAAKIRAIEVSKPKYKGTSLEGENILAAAYLEMRALAKPFAHWPPEPPMAEKIKALRKALEK